MHDQPNTRTQATTIALYVLGAFTVVMGVVAGSRIYQAYKAEGFERGQYYPLLFWAAFNTVAGIAAALWAWSWKPTEGARGAATNPTKLIILGVGGVLGFTTVIFLGLGYVYLWWDDLVKARAAWKDFKTWVPALLILGGLTVMLISVLVVRSEERHNVVLRRLVYGYNAVLVGLLVFAILGVGNVMASIYAFRPLDWTETNIYSLSEPSKRILEGLDTPVKVFVQIRPDDPLYDDVRTLLDGCRSYTDQLTVEYAADPRVASRIAQEYELQADEPVVVVYDPEGTRGKPVPQAIKQDDLEDFGARFASGGGQRSFKGERAIISAIRNLSEGKVTRVVYFTQDSGEMKLSDFGSGRERPGTLDRGLGALKGRLEKAGYTVKELILGQIDPDAKEGGKVPDDAFAVVMAGPTDLGEPSLAAAKIKVLQDYMRRKDGRMLILLEARRNRDGLVQPTGLEGFLAGFGVMVGNDIVLHRPVSQLPDPTIALVGPFSQVDRSLALMFLSAPVIPLLDVRSVQPLPGATSFNVQRLLETLRIVPQWAEESLRGNPDEFIENLRTKEPDEYNRRVRSPAVSVAVTVRDKSVDPSMPDDPVHARARQGDGAPRMVVFGADCLASNAFIERGRGDVYYTLTAGSLSWLRGGEKDVIPEIEPKQRNQYRLNTKPEDLNRVLYMPVLVLLIGVVGAGIAVLGFIRRR